MGSGLTKFLINLPIAGVGLVAFGSMVLASIAGHLVHRIELARRHGEQAEQADGQEGYLVSAVLGLLALLLAFTFGLALDRFETRRQLVTQEANAIGTAYLRAQLLDDPHRARLSNLLIAYTDNRIALATSPNSATLAKNDRLLADIWTAVRASRESAAAHGVTTALLQAYNEVIDLDTERKVARRLRVPNEVFVLLFGYTLLTAAILGYLVERPRGRRAAGALFILIATAISVITDLNRPISGNIQESQEPMRMLQRLLAEQPPQVFDRLNASTGQASRDGLSP